MARNVYLDAYRNAVAHQAEHIGTRFSRAGLWAGQPNEVCWECLAERKARATHHGIKREYAWAVPNDEALDVIAEHSPHGVVEIGAGGGYWAYLLRDRGVDVIAYDPDPKGVDGWHSGRRWSEVLFGDETAVIGHSDRTLLLVWPSYTLPWTDRVLDLYEGETVIYVGEGVGGCTGTDRMHEILGMGSDCWHDDPAEARFREIADVDIPQWAGIHDRLTVHRRV